MTMNSRERKERRYLRRKAKRDAKKAALLAEYGAFERAASRDALAKAALDAAKGVAYKASVQRYLQRRIVNTAIASRALERGADVHKGFVCFKTIERGKLREIMSTRFSERVIHKSLNQNVLLPVMSRSLIYDNGASLKGKGTSFALERLTTQLRRHYRRYGDKGCVLKADIKSYFASIDHEVIKKRIRQTLSDEKAAALTCRLVDAYYEHYAATDPSAERKGLGLGSEVNQTLAVVYLDPLDHCVKEVLRVKGYGRYNDDFYLISDSREYLEACRAKIKAKLDELKLNLNEKKVSISPLSQGFTFLKTRVALSPSGGILRRPCRDSVVRARRKLKRQKKLLEDGVMTFDAVRRSYQSWRGSMKRRRSGRTVHSMDRLFDRLFIENWRDQS